MLKVFSKAALIAANNEAIAGGCDKTLDPDLVAALPDNFFPVVSSYAQPSDLGATVRAHIDLGTGAHPFVKVLDVSAKRFVRMPFYDTNAYRARTLTRIAAAVAGEAVAV